MDIINILKEHIGDWLISYDDLGDINHIQRIDEITPYNYSVIINGPIIRFRQVDVLIERNNIDYSIDYEYLLFNLKNIGFYTNEDFKNEIGNLIVRYLNF